MSTPSPRVFISATSGDLRSVRLIAKESLLTIGCHPVEQTNFEPDWRSVEGMLRAESGETGRWSPDPVSRFRTGTHSIIPLDRSDSKAVRRRFTSSVSSFSAARRSFSVMAASKRVSSSRAAVALAASPAAV